MKRLITDNTSASGELDTEKFMRAMLQYRNTPDTDTKLSPAQAVFGRQIRDFVPVLPGKYKPDPVWTQTAERREEALRCRHRQAEERLSEHTKRLPPLVVGDLVRIQNQTGRFPRKWDKTGRVVEVRQYDQYVIRTDGSGRLMVRNRKFLRRYIPYDMKNEVPVIDWDKLRLVPTSQPAPRPPLITATPQPIPAPLPGQLQQPGTATPAQSPTVRQGSPPPANSITPA